jgi:hypothetical protein
MQAQSAGRCASRRRRRQVRLDFVVDGPREDR